MSSVRKSEVMDVENNGTENDKAVSKEKLEASEELQNGEKSQKTSDEGIDKPLSSNNNNSEQKNENSNEQSSSKINKEENVVKMKKDDSGISVEKCGSSSEEEVLVKQTTSVDTPHSESLPKDNTSDKPSFPKIKFRLKRNYRLRKRDTDSDNKSSDGEESPIKLLDDIKRELDASSDSGNEEINGIDIEETSIGSVEVEPSDCNSSNVSERSVESGESRKESSENEHENEPENEEDPPVPEVLLKQKPKHKWFVVKEIINRQRGVSSHYQESELFQQRCYGSLHCVERLELMYKLKRHTGCVNALNFNSSGSLLASGSDDLKVVIWNWPVGELLVSYDSGHRANVFQVKFLPLSGDTHVVSCSRDGQIRLAELSSTGVCRSTRRLAQHRSATHKLAVNPDLPHVVFSAGEDAVAMSMDVRTSKADKIVTVKEGERKIPLYSIHSNPLNSDEFCVGGRDYYVRVYDRRKISDNEFLKRFCPQHLVQANSSTTHVTCAMYNYNGSEILASYNDEDIYLFDARSSDEDGFIHRYGGHRNSATVKGVSFFGPKSEYVVSGSDCSNIYFWEKETESIVQWMPGDENGVVNCLEPHPQIPILATSGLDDDIKIWVPSCETEPKMNGLKTTVVDNCRERAAELEDISRTFDGQMLWVLWRQFRHGEHSRRRRAERASRTDGEGNPTDSSSSSDSDDNQSGVQCSPS